MFFFFLDWGGGEEENEFCANVQLIFLVDLRQYIYIYIYIYIALHFRRVNYIFCLVRFCTFFDISFHFFPGIPFPSEIKPLSLSATLANIRFMTCVTLGYQLCLCV